MRVLSGLDGGMSRFRGQGVVGGDEMEAGSVSNPAVALLIALKNALKLTSKFTPGNDSVIFVETRIKTADDADTTCPKWQVHVKGRQNTWKTLENVEDSLNELTSWASPLWSSGRVAFESAEWPPDAWHVRLYRWKKGHLEPEPDPVFLISISKGTVAHPRPRFAAAAHIPGSQVDAKTLGLLAGRGHPIVLRGAAQNWPCAEWKPAYFESSPYSNLHVAARFAQKRRDSRRGLWESECTHARVKLGQFARWLRYRSSASDRASASGEVGGLNSTYDAPPLESLTLDSRFPQKLYWGYASYLHFETLFGQDAKIAHHATRFLECAQQLSGDGDSPTSLSSRPVLWLGSRGAVTRLHYDTFGFNIVAQIHGEKRWLLFPPDQSQYLYPTRIPFEESGVYSEIDPADVNPNTHPLALLSTPLGVDMRAGDLLVVPRHWWHRVSVSSPSSVSVNQWVDIPARDRAERVRESVAHAVLAAVSRRQAKGQGALWSSPGHAYCSVLEKPNVWSGPGESIQPLDDALETMSAAMKGAGVAISPVAARALLVDALTHPCVVNIVAEACLSRGRAMVKNRAKPRTDREDAMDRVLGCAWDRFPLLPRSLRVLDWDEAYYIYQEIFVRESYIIPELDLDAGGPPRRILDLGANIGLFSIYCKARWPESRVIAVEPLAEAYAALTANLSLVASDGSARCMRAGVSNCRRTAQLFWYYPKTPGESTLRPRERNTRLRVIQREAQSAAARARASDSDLTEALNSVSQQAGESIRSGDDLRSCNVFTISDVLRWAATADALWGSSCCIDLLKIDVEGEELKALEGLEPGDWKRIRRFVVEVSSPDGSNRLADVCNLLRRNQFRVFVHKQHSEMDGKSGYLAFLPESAGMHMVYAVRRVERKRNRGADSGGEAVSEPEPKRSQKGVHQGAAV